MRVLWIAVLMLAAMGARAQEGADGAVVVPSTTPVGPHGVPRVEFSFVPREGVGDTWKIKLFADGTGTYQVTGQQQQMPITVSAPILGKLMAAEDRAKAGGCETKAKNIAFTGKKQLAYGGADVATCSFNYSDDESVNQVASVFQSIAWTMQVGERMKQLRRFDRLGLDAEMIQLEEALKEKRALEVQNIAPVLRSIAGDDRVIERVRRKASRMADEAGGAVEPMK